MSQHPYCIPINILIVSAYTLVVFGDSVSGIGIPPGTTVIGITSYGDNPANPLLQITLNQVLWTSDTPPNGITGDGCQGGWVTDVVFGKFTLGCCDII